MQINVVYSTSCVVWAHLAELQKVNGNRWKKRTSYLHRMTNQVACSIWQNTLSVTYDKLAICNIWHTSSWCFVILKQQEIIEYSFTQTVSLGFTHPAPLGLELKLRLKFELVSLSLSIPVIPTPFSAIVIITCNDSRVTTLFRKRDQHGLPPLMV